MEHTVGGATQRHIHGQGVHECLFCHNIAGADILADKLHNRHTRVLGQLNARGVHGGDGAVPAKPHSECLGETVHGVCRVHTRARTAGGAGFALVLIELFVGDPTRVVRTDRLKHGGKAGFLAFHSACKHGTAADEHGGNIHARRRHEKPGHVLVAVGHHDEPVKAVGQDHGLGGVGDQITGNEGVFHARVTHGDAVANGNGGKYNGRSPCHGDTDLDRFYDLVEIHVPGHDFIIGTDDANERTFLFFFCQTQGVKQTAVRGVVHARNNIFLRHNATSYQLLMSLSSSLQLYSLRISAPTTSEGCSLARFLMALK